MFFPPNIDSPACAASNAQVTSKFSYSQVLYLPKDEKLFCFARKKEKNESEIRGKHYFDEITFFLR